MKAHTHYFEISTEGNNQIINITDDVLRAVADSGAAAGLLTVFINGSTAGITTTEFEPGLVNHDIAAAFERIAPERGHYEHEETWHDDNGHAHVRAAMLGPTLTLPIIEGTVPLGQWQQIVFVDFDTRARKRKIAVQILG